MAQEKFLGQVEALMREGAKDLHNAVVAAFPQSIRGVDEPGTPLNPTQQMVTTDIVSGRSDYEQMLSGYANRGQHQNQEHSRQMER